MSARFAFAAHPEAITDLRELPAEICDEALLSLQDLVHGRGGACRLDGRLDGFHKVYLGAATHRLVIQFRDAPPSSQHTREIYFVAAGARQDYAVYRTAQLRTNRVGPNHPASDDHAVRARVQAARSRSPRAIRHSAPPAPAAPATTTSTPTTTRKATLR